MSGRGRRVSGAGALEELSLQRGGGRWSLALNGKVVIVTGGTRGIGADIALGFAEEGAQVAICARTGADLEAKAGRSHAATGATAVGIAVDLRKRGEPERLVDEVVKRFGRLDVLVNSAGVAPGGNIEELTDDDWERGIQLKLLGLVRCTRAAIPVMRGQGGGRIVNVVGNDGVKCAYWEIVPAICCAAEQIFTATIAEEYGPEGIYVNAVNPGPVETGLMRGLFEHIAKRRGVPSTKSWMLTWTDSPEARPHRGATGGHQRRAVSRLRSSELRQRRLGEHRRWTDETGAGAARVQPAAVSPDMPLAIVLARRRQEERHRVAAAIPSSP